MPAELTAARSTPSRDSDRLDLLAGAPPFAYQVEAARVGQPHRLRKLTLDITTDGPSTRRTRSAEAPEILIRQLAIFHDTRRWRVFGETAAIDGAGAGPDGRARARMENFPIEELELGVRSYNCLKPRRYRDDRRLVMKTENELARSRTSGRSRSRRARRPCSSTGSTSRRQRRRRPHERGPGVRTGTPGPASALPPAANRPRCASSVRTRSLGYELLPASCIAWFSARRKHGTAPGVPLMRHARTGKEARPRLGAPARRCTRT